MKGACYEVLPVLPALDCGAQGEPARELRSARHEDAALGELPEPLFAALLHGHLVLYRDGEWFYEDGEPALKERPCPRCGGLPTPEGYDSCLGHIPGAVSACCMHGHGGGFCIMADGTRHNLEEDRPAIKPRRQP